MTPPKVFHSAVFNPAKSVKIFGQIARKANVYGLISEEDDLVIYTSPTHIICRAVCYDHNGCIKTLSYSSASEFPL